eukprot:jgi/Chrpa1/26649/Chrysochromulina_OHIO_Genome00025723-RA
MDPELKLKLQARASRLEGAPACDAPAASSGGAGDELANVLAARKAALDQPAASAFQRPALRQVSGESIKGASALLPIAPPPSVPPPSMPPSTASEHPAACAFADMLAATEVAGIQSSFEAVIAGCFGEGKVPMWPTLSSLLPTLRGVLPHRSKLLLEVLEARMAQPQYAATMAKQAALQAKALNVAMIGAGPVGLRCAIELAMLGCRVEVLHLWDWVEADLSALGLKLLDPSVFTASDLRRCSTCQLQHSLLKLALLLGVRVRFGSKVESVVSLGTRRVDVIVDASGARCELLDGLGFSQTVAL